ncbi:MAG: 5'-nucleotidase C-terminal domain-containing protein [Dysgonamonadaceae bacterium]|jgi:2',3'-cyclic-nucleotide 2'-phosphodiesterase (5'-nucleotidase family)|nr:5'-nucleotidase C-terminal domain-containing protein [Dysgonamonadaceae bacterium]
MKKELLKICIILLSAAMIACSGGEKYKIKEVRVSRTLMDKTWDSPADTPMKTLVDSFKTLLGGKINEEIGCAAQDLLKGKPQSLLGNFTADAMFDFGTEEWGSVDFAITNLGGMRAVLNKGPVTVGEMYEIYPFDNHLVLLELKGEPVEKLFRVLAAKGGEAISKNVELVISGKEPESLKIGNKPVAEDKTYRIVTVDYLAEGNDGMMALTEAVNMQESKSLIREMMIAHVRKLTAGKHNIEAKFDNRIKIK